MSEIRGFLLPIFRPGGGFFIGSVRQHECHSQGDEGAQEASGEAVQGVGQAVGTFEDQDHQQEGQGADSSLDGGQSEASAQHHVRHDTGAAEEVKEIRLPGEIVGHRDDHPQQTAPEDACHADQGRGKRRFRAVLDAHQGAGGDGQGLNAGPVAQQQACRNRHADLHVHAFGFP